MSDWRMVPVEPTREMLDAYDDAIEWMNKKVSDGGPGPGYRAMAQMNRTIGSLPYKAMLAAAPKPPNIDHGHYSDHTENPESEAGRGI